MKVLIFDDLLVRRSDEYRVRGLDLVFVEHADDAAAVVVRERPQLVLMDFSMGEHRSGADAIVALRRVYDGRIVGISSDPESNERMRAAGADDAIPKTHLRAYLSRIARPHVIGGGGS
jgi:CheY-like chemotaxis protein